MADNAKKNILTYAGLQELEAELEDLKVNKRKEVAQKIKEAENRVTYQKMLNMMQQKMNKEILKLVSKKSKKSSRT